MASAVVKARITGADAAFLEVSTSPTFTGYATFTGTAGNDNMWTFEPTGLDAETQHYWRIRGSAVEGSFRTPPAAGTAYSFTVAVASCAGDNDYPGTGKTSNAPTFDRIADRDPDLFIHLGDIHYQDISSNTVGLYRTAYQDVLSNARQADLYRDVPLVYVWDDHDYGPNNSDGTYVGKAAAQQAYREYVPHHTLPDADAIYHTFVIGRVRFIMLDVRSERTPNSATDDASKTMLGATQKQWLKDTLTAATEPAIVLAVNNPWIEPHADNWSSFSTERQELAEFFEDNSLTSKLILIAGDWHMMAADDGTNTQFDPDAVTDGPPLLHFAPMDRTHSAHTATYSEGTFKTSEQQYGTIEFTDDGSSITATAKGWAVTDDTESESLSLVMGPFS